MVKEFLYYTYKITFRDLPGYFYYGRKKDNGKPYFGSPKTFKHFWDQFEPEIQILQWYRTSKEVHEAECALIKHTWKQTWGGKRYCLNRNCRGSFDEEASSRGGRKGGRKGGQIGGRSAVKKKSGIHDPDYLASEKCKKLRIKNGNKLVEEGKGLFSPEYLQSTRRKEQKQRTGKRLLEEEIGLFDPKHRGKGAKRTAEKYSKPIVCVETGKVYQSGYHASRETGIIASNVRRSARSDGKSKAGGFSWKFI